MAENHSEDSLEFIICQVLKLTATGESREKGNVASAAEADSDDLRGQCPNPSMAESVKHHLQQQQLSMAAASTGRRGSRRGEWKRKLKENFEGFDQLSESMKKSRNSSWSPRPVHHSRQQQPFEAAASTGVQQKLFEAAASTGVQGSKRGRKPLRVLGDIPEKKKRGRKSKVKDDPEEFRVSESKGCKLMGVDPKPEKKKRGRKSKVKDDAEEFRPPESKGCKLMGVDPGEDQNLNAPAQKIPGLTCHQCKRNDKGSVVHCKKCNKKYCHKCIQAWYPSRGLEYIAEACPYCRENCNCRACLQTNLEVKVEKFSVSDRVHFLQKVIHSGLPVLNEIRSEEIEELKLEARIQNKPVQELEIPEDALHPEERQICDQCKVSLVNLHRNCDDCHNYDLCLACCRKFRERSQTGPDSTVEKEHSSIPCGRDICYGLLKLKCTPFGPNWVAKIRKKALDIVSNAQFPTALTDSKTCSVCLKLNSELFSDKLRKAANRKKGKDDYLYCPTVQDVKGETPEHFQDHLKRGEPVIVRNVLENTKGLSWEPMVMWRAFREPRETKESRKPKDSNEVSVIDCSNWQMFNINIRQFFTAYEEEAGCQDNPLPRMWKLKDWPPAEFFEERLPRHCAEFISALPFKQYTDPKSGILNLATRIPEGYAKPDLGPKTYIAFGRREELPEGGDSVTNLHCDMADAVNVIMHTAEASASREKLGENYSRSDGLPMISRNMENENAESGDALWDIFRRKDTPKLRAYLKKHKGDFRYYNNLSHLDVQDPIHDQLFYLNAEHKRKLKEEYGIEAWTFEQHLGEAVFIPAGCPHQVRNLKPSIKVALDFVSPENLPECIRLTEEFRSLSDDHPSQADKLGVKKIVVYALESAAKELKDLAEESS